MAENNNNNITYFGETNFRNERKRFGIKRRDRARHMYIIGKTGVGKTTLLENMAIQDILTGEGVGIVDPHGEFAEKMLKFVPENRIEDVLYFAPHDMDWPIAFNVMENVDPTQRHLVANGLLGVFKKIWPDVWSPRMEYILNNCILALLEYPNSTLLGINRMLSDKAYRDDVVDNISDPVVKAFWTDEFSKYSERFMTEAGAAIQNKVGQFISNPIIRNIIGQPKSSFDIRDIMDQKKIFIMNLSKGRIGEENSRLIGAMLITKIYLAAMSRVDVPEPERQDFYLYVDEFQNFANESFKDILSEARKYRLNLVLAHQYIAQMDENVRDAVFGNVGTLITFRIGSFDAEVVEKEFSPEFEAQDIVSLGFGNIYLKLMIDGMASRPFSALTLPPIKPQEETFEEKITESSRDKYATSRKEVEEKIAEWHSQINQELQVEKSSKPTKSIPHFSDKESEKPQVYEAVCAVCGKKTYVPFKPDGKRAIYCKNHRPGQQTHSYNNNNQDSHHQGGNFQSKPGSRRELKKDIRTMASGFHVAEDAKSQLNEADGEPIYQQEVISLAELDRKKKHEPKIDELRKILDEAMREDDHEKAGEEINEDDLGGSLASGSADNISDNKNYNYNDFDDEEIVTKEILKEREPERDNREKIEDSKDSATGKNVLKPGDKIKFGQ